MIYLNGDHVSNTNHKSSKAYILFMEEKIVFCRCLWCLLHFLTLFYKKKKNVYERMRRLKKKLHKYITTETVIHSSLLSKCNIYKKIMMV